MFILIVKHNGKILKEVELETGVDYTIGRAQDNHIVLPKEHGISRKHLSFMFMEEGDSYTGQVKNLSRVSALSVEGQEVETADINIGQSFHIKDFEFILQKQKPENALVAESPEESPSPVSEKDPIENEAQVEEENISSPKNTESSSVLDVQKSDIPISPDGATQVMSIQDPKFKMSAYIVVSCDAIKNRFTLDGQDKWIIGRDEESDITIDNHNISRKHCKITKKNEKYYIRDLESANGTLLNNKELSPGKKYPLKSGDMIYILDVDILFEIKNLSLEKELKNIVLPASPPPSSSLPASFSPSTPPASSSANLPYVPSANAGVPTSYVPPQVLPEEAPGVIVEMPEDASSFFKRNKKRLVIYAGFLLLAGALVSVMKEDKVDNQTQEDSNIIKIGELAGLTHEQGQLVKRLFQSAQQLFSQGKFEYCQSEIQKIYEITENYKDSKRLQLSCQRAAEDQKRLYDIERKRKREEEAERKIAEVTQKCDEKFSTFQHKFQLVECLNPAIELSPDDSRIQSLTERFDAIEFEKEEKLKQAKERRALIGSIARKYTQAKKIYKSGNVLKAMPAYQKFIDISKKYKELRDKHDLAKRELANIKKNFQDTNNSLIKKCKQVFNSQAFKKAYYTCEKSKKKVPPPYNAPAIELMKQARNKLEHQMKPFYEEANLNESMGNVEIAKGHWKTILSKDVSTGIYYKRAKEKLDRY